MKGLQGQPLTRRLLEAVGLTPGMRVLDRGSGSGNVARLAAELVGPDGAVIGVEKDPEAVELARQHTDAPNVEFRVADAQTLDGRCRTSDLDIAGTYEAKSGVADLADSVRPLGSSHSSCRPRAVRSRK